MSLKQTASYQLGTSQQLINTDLDITLDNMTNNFIPNISTLGRETRPHDAGTTLPKSSRIPITIPMPQVVKEQE